MTLQNGSLTGSPGRGRGCGVELIGDSISIGYTVAVRMELAGKGNVHRISENGGDTVNGLMKIEDWLGSSHWDVIHFNWAAHDLKVTPEGGRQVPIETYEKNLGVLVARLKTTGARLIWAATTVRRRIICKYGIIRQNSVQTRQRYLQLDVAPSVHRLRAHVMENRQYIGYEHAPQFLDGLPTVTGLMVQCLMLKSLERRGPQHRRIPT